MRTLTSMNSDLRVARRVAHALIAELVGSVDTDRLDVMRAEADRAAPEQSIMMAIDCAVAVQARITRQTLADTARWFETCRYFGGRGRSRLRDEMLGEIKELAGFSAAA